MPGIKLPAGVDLGGQKATNLAPGTNPTDAVTFSQLAALQAGFVVKEPVRAATTGTITLSGLQTVDGVALAAGNRVLVKDQTTATQNGVYVAASGAWSRATDYDDGSEIRPGTVIPVNEGSNGDALFLLATDAAVTVGSTALAFTRVGGVGVTYSAGNGISINGSTVAAVVKAGGGLVVDSSGLSIDPSFAKLSKRYSGDVPPGSASTVITHDLGTKDVSVTVRDAATDEVVLLPWTATSTNTVTLSFAAAPTSGQYRVVILA